MNTNWRLVLVMLGVAVLVVTAGCGGNSNGDPTQTLDPGVQTTVPDRTGATNSTVTGVQVEDVSFNSNDDTVTVSLKNTGDETVDLDVVEVSVHLETSEDTSGVDQVRVPVSGSLSPGASVTASTSLTVSSSGVVGYTAFVSCDQLPDEDYPYCPGDSGIRYPDDTDE